MKHFDEARQDVLTTLSLQVVVEHVEKICAIFDLKGRCRILAIPAEGKDPAVVQTALQPLFKVAADVFWGDEDVWVESKSGLPSRRAIYEAVWKEAKPHSSTSGKQWILDRHLSKDAWFGSPFELPWPLNDRTPPIISFFSFKGGVGRTTALAAFATNLARAGKRVLVVDFDLEAPGVGTLFGPTRGDGTSFGVVDFLLEWPVAPNGTINIADYCNVCDEPGIVGSGPEIICVPAGKVDERFIEKLARINYEYLYRSASEPGAPVADKSPIHQLLKLLRDRWKPDFVLIDSRAGLHDLGGLSLSGIAHWHVLFGLNSDQSWQGLSLAVSHLGKQEVLAGNTQRDCTLVQGMTPFPQAGREQAVATFKSQAYEVFSNLYYDDAQSPNAVWPVPDSEDPDQPHSPQVLSWDTRVFGYGPLTDIAGILCEGEYRTLTNAILDKTRETNTVTAATKLSRNSVPELLDCIIAMGSGGIAESVRDEEFLRHFYPLPEHARALDPHVLLVIGDRGAGKTHLFRAIQSQAGLQAIISLAAGRPIPPTNQCDWLVGFNSEGAAHPPEMVFQKFAAGKEPIALQHAWLGLLIKRLVAAKAIEASSLPKPMQIAVSSPKHDLAALADCSSSHLIELFGVLDAFDAKLREDDRWLFMSYDALDRVSSGDWDVMKLVIRGLVQFWASNSRRWSRLRPKIFLRRDLFERVALFGPDVSKIAAQRVELVWTPRHLYKMILKRMMNQDKRLRRYVEQLQLPGQDDKNLGWCAGDISEEQLQKFAELLCGEFMGAGPNKGRTYTWIPNHLQDGNGHILPRSFVRLFESAAQVEKEAQRANWPHLIHHTSLRAAVDDVSENRVQEIAEEFPWLKAVQFKLSQLNAILPFERTKLERLLDIKWNGSTERPPETSGRDLLKLLMELGIFYSKADRKSDTRVDVRDLYLKGFGFKRKGGVAHLR